MGELKTLAVSQIKESEAALRDVNRKDVKFLELVDSVKEKGVIQTITVRPSDVKDEKDSSGRPMYRLVDGLHRYTAALEAGVETINVVVKDITDEEAWKLQIVTNLHKIETKPIQFTRALRRMIANRPSMPRTQLASELGKSVQWINDRLSLSKLNPSIQALIDEGKITLGNAFSLAKLPEDEQDAFKERAMTEESIVFAPTVSKRVSEIKAAAREGRKATEEKFSPVAHLRKMAELSKEIESPEIGPSLVQHYGVKTAEEGFALGVKYAVHLDGDSIKAAEDTFNKKMAQKAERAEKLKIEKAKKAAEAKEKRAKKALAEAEEAKKKVLTGK